MRLVRVAATAVAGVAVLAGCSGGQTANETLPSTSASAADTSATLPPLGPPDLPMPDEAREQTPAGAEAFLQYYIGLMNQAQARLVSTYIRDLSSSCGTCDTFADGVDAYTAQGYRMNGGVIDLTSSSTPALTDGEAEFSIALTQRALTVTSESAGTVSESPESSFPASGASLSWDRSRSSWLMADLTIQ